MRKYSFIFTYVLGVLLLSPLSSNVSAAAAEKEAPSCLHACCSPRAKQPKEGNVRGIDSLVDAQSGIDLFPVHNELRKIVLRAKKELPAPGKASDEQILSSNFCAGAVTVVYQPAPDQPQKLHTTFITKDVVSASLKPLIKLKERHQEAVACLSGGRHSSNPADPFPFVSSPARDKPELSADTRRFFNGPSFNRDSELFEEYLGKKAHQSIEEYCPKHKEDSERFFFRILTTNGAIEKITDDVRAHLPPDAVIVGIAGNCHTHFDMCENCLGYGAAMTWLMKQPGSRRGGLPQIKNSLLKAFPHVADPLLTFVVSSSVQYINKDRMSSPESHRFYPGQLGDFDINQFRYPANDNGCAQVSLSPAAAASEKPQVKRAEPGKKKLQALEIGSAKPLGIFVQKVSDSVKNLTDNGDIMEAAAFLQKLAAELIKKVQPALKPPLLVIEEEKENRDPAAVASVMKTPQSGQSSSRVGQSLSEDSTFGKQKKLSVRRSSVAVESPKINTRRQLAF